MEKFPPIARIGLLGLFVLLGTAYLPFPGLQTDEVLFTNLALGEINHTTYIGKKIGGITFFVLSYIGALKSWLFLPIFKVFGYNYYSIRLPMLLLTAVSLFFVFRITQLAFKVVLLSWVVLILLVVEPTLIGMVRTDVGPIALEYFFKVMAVFFLFKYVFDHQKQWLIGLGLCLCLGIFNKFNFIWLANAILGSALFLFPVIEKQRRRFFLIALVVCFGFVVLMLLGIVLLNPGMLGSNAKVAFDSAYFNHKSGLFYHYFKGIFNGNRFYESQYLQTYYDGKLSRFSVYIDSHFKYLFEVGAFLIGVAAIKVGRLIFQKRATNSHFLFFFFLSVILITSVQIFVVSNAINIWHYYTVFPFYTFCLIYSIYFLFSSKLKWVQYSFFAAFFIMNVHGYAKYLYAFANRTPTTLWSNRITDLATFLEPIQGEFVELEWGLSTQLLTLTRQDKFTPGFIMPNGYFVSDVENPSKAFYDTFVANKNLSTLYFISVESSSSTKIVKKIVEKMCKERGFSIRNVKDLYEQDGSLLYRIFQIEK
jgi:Dolichyl-phosphate-mannose-protein mannosyltransferase